MRDKNSGAKGIGNAGDLCKVIFEDGKYIVVILADTKGSDAGNHFGHPFGGVIDMCEWYCRNDLGGIPPNVPEKGKRVVKVENYGSWIDG